MKRRRDESDSDRSSDGSDDGADLEGFLTDKESSEVEVAEDDEEVMKKEAEKITATIKGTVVGTRVLRDRSAIKPVTRYFDTEAYERLLVEDEKKEKLAALKKWNGTEGFVLSSNITKKSSAEDVEVEYRRAKRILDIDDTDEEDAEEDDEEDEEDEDEDEDEEDDDAEDDDDDEDEDEEDEADDDDDADADGECGQVAAEIFAAVHGPNWKDKKCEHDSPVWSCNKCQ